MILNKPNIFKQFPNLIFGLSKKYVMRGDKFNFNMSKSIGDDEKSVSKNRQDFFFMLGLNLENVIVQKQIHSDIVNVVTKFRSGIEGDALITSTKNLGLAISTADCTNIFLYDSSQEIIAAVHSGWAGTEKKILKKTVDIMINEYSTNPKNLFVYLGPSICKDNYEVGTEFINKFESKYLSDKGEKYLLDLKQANKDMLLNSGLRENQIEISEICSFGNEQYQSYRRDKDISGRALGVIAMVH
jgi:hypothetical protein